MKYIPGDTGSAFIIGISLNVLFIIVEVITGIINNSMSFLPMPGTTLVMLPALYYRLSPSVWQKKNQQRSLLMVIKKPQCLLPCLMRFSY